MIKTPIISEDQFKIALKLIKMGEIIVFPTDTVYAIGANIYDEYAVRMINLVKKKSINEPLMLYVDT
ncbi:Sua5/YciO/YrdC/YwlC family protein, partial [Borreliella burgdorferi]